MITIERDLPSGPEGLITGTVLRGEYHLRICADDDNPIYFVLACRTREHFELLLKTINDIGKTLLIAGEKN